MTNPYIRAFPLDKNMAAVATPSLGGGPQIALAAAGGGLIIYGRDSLLSLREAVDHALKLPEDLGSIES